MSRNLLPDDGKAFVSSHVLFHCQLPAPIRDTYTMFRILAWGKSATPELSWQQIEEMLGKDRQTIYRHMLTLVNIGAARLRTARVGNIILEFTDGIHGAPDLSQKRESLNKDLKAIKTLKVIKGRRGVGREGTILKNETNELPHLREWRKAYVSWLGYDPENRTQEDDSALAWLSQNYTIEQVKEVYLHMKSEKNKSGTAFWADKQIKPKHLRTRVVEYHNAKKAGQIGATQRRERA